MNVQIDLLNKTIKKNLKKKFKRQSELSRHLGGSLFMTAIGVNDYAFTYKKNPTDANEFASKLLNEFLIHLEVQNVRVFNIIALAIHYLVLIRTVYFKTDSYISQPNKYTNPKSFSKKTLCLDFLKETIFLKKTVS